MVGDVWRYVKEKKTWSIKQRWHSSAEAHDHYFERRKATGPRHEPGGSAGWYRRASSSEKEVMKVWATMEKGARMWKDGEGITPAKNKRCSREIGNCVNCACSVV